MGTESYRHYTPAPCANCGKRPGYRGSSTWGHSHGCCSEACGVRLGKKLAHGMGGVHPDHLFPGFLGLPFNPFAEPVADEERIKALRLRVKVLEGLSRARDRWFRKVYSRQLVKRIRAEMERDDLRRQRDELRAEVDAAQECNALLWTRLAGAHDPHGVRIDASDEEG